MNVNNDSGADTGQFESYKSPTEMFKGRLVNLLFDCILHNSKCYNDKNEKYAFARKTWDLAVMMERFTPSSKRKELNEWKKQLKEEIKKIREDKGKPTPSEKNDAIMDLEYFYAEEVHMHNQRILINSPIIEVDVEGDLDVTEESTLDIIKLGDRKDDGRIVFKQ